MSSKLTELSQLKPNDLQRYFGIASYESARRLAVTIRDCYGAKMLTVLHISKYLGLPSHEVITALSGIK
jgi:hypothetical protein